MVNFVTFLLVVSSTFDLRCFDRNILPGIETKPQGKNVTNDSARIWGLSSANKRYDKSFGDCKNPKSDVITFRLISAKRLNFAHKRDNCI